MNSNNILGTMFSTDRDSFLGKLNSVVIIDIGIIKSVTNGRAKVLTSRYVKAQRVVYDDVEIVYPGNANGTFQCDCAGSACLIFIPRSCIADIRKHTVFPNDAPYSRNGIKVMPIGNGVSNNVRVSFDSMGDLILLTDVYRMTFTEDSFQLLQDSTLQISKDCQGQLYLRYKGEDTGVLELNIGEEGITSTYGSKDGSVSWKDSLDTSGVRTLEQKDNNGNVLSTISIDTEGTISISGKEIHLNGNENHVVMWEDLNSTLQDLWSAIKGHTHQVSTEGTAAAQTGTAFASTSLSTKTLDLGDAKSSDVLID